MKTEFFDTLKKTDNSIPHTQNLKCLILKQLTYFVKFLCSDYIFFGYFNILITFVLGNFIGLKYFKVKGTIFHAWAK